MRQRMIRTSLYALSLAIVASSASATEYRCQVEQKIYWGKEYTPRQIAAGQFSNIVEETKQGAFVSRCSYEQSAARVTCDRYKADRVVLDDYAHIKKFYFFESQFDFQLFPDLGFIENNGRGGVSYGHCSIVSP